MRSHPRRRTVGLFSLALLASPAIVNAAVTATIDNLNLGGINTYPLSLTVNQIGVFMTTPIGSLNTNFASPDTIASGLNPSNTIITQNDDAGTDGVGAGTVIDTHGSLLRYRATAVGNYSWQVRGFLDAQSGPYIATRTVFEVGVTPGDFTDTESNNTIATAQPLALPAGSAKLGFGNLTPGDADVFSIAVQPGDVISAATVPLSGLPTNFSSVNTVIEVRDSSGALILTNDDAGFGSDAVGNAPVDPETGSAFRYLSTTAQTINVNVHGFDANSTGDYAMMISNVHVPEPTGAMTTVLAGLSMLKRRRAL